MPYFCLVSKFYCSTPSISIPNTRSYMESLEMASQKNWEERSWTGIEGRHKICSFWYWYCVCINFREYTEVGPSPQKETMKTLMFKCFLTTCVSIRVFFFSFPLFSTHSNITKCWTLPLLYFYKAWSWTPYTDKTPVEVSESVLATTGFSPVCNILGYCVTL